MKNDPPDESLAVLLHGWKLNAEPTPRFSEGVWRRIAQREAEAEAATWSSRCKNWLGSVTRSSDFAWGTVAAVLVTAGAAWLGFEDTGHSAADSPSSASYLAAVDPYRMNP